MIALGKQDYCLILSFLRVCDDENEEGIYSEGSMLFCRCSLLKSLVAAFIPKKYILQHESSILSSIQNTATEDRPDGVRFPQTNVLELPAHSRFLIEREINNGRYPEGRATPYSNPELSLTPAYKPIIKIDLCQIP